jgi:putative redox protein
MQYKFEKPVHGISGIINYQCTIEWRNGKIIADEPVTSGGTDSGPDPYSLLLASLASCTLITMRMYIDHKGWEVPDIAVKVNLFQETKDDKIITIIDKDIRFLSEIDAEQKARLLEIAKHCPISKILEGEIKVRSFIFLDEETDKVIKYPNDEITVLWKPEFCQHSGRCWSQLPEVFDYKKKHWITPEGASSEKIIEQIKKCPSGALGYIYNKDNKS